MEKVCRSIFAVDVIVSEIHFIVVVRRGSRADGKGGQRKILVFQPAILAGQLSFRPSFIFRVWLPESKMPGQRGAEQNFVLLGRGFCRIFFALTFDLIHAF